MVKSECADEFSRLGCVGVSWGLGGGNSIGFPPILNYGTGELKEKLLPGILNGSIRVCLGITEPHAGSDVAGIRTTAEKSKDGTHYIVNGQKKWYLPNTLPRSLTLTEGLQMGFGRIMLLLQFAHGALRLARQGYQFSLFH